MIRKSRLVFTLLSFLTVALMTAGAMTAAANRDTTDGGDSLYKYLSVFMEVFSLVNKAYVDEPDSDVLMSGAFEGTLDALDPFSQYIPERDVEAFRGAQEVGISHSGMLVLKEQGVAYVVAVEEGGPADRADLAPGDILSTLDGRSTRSMPLHHVQQLLTAPVGTVLPVERIRQGEKEVVELTLATYDHPGVELSTHKGVPVLRIPGFHGGTPADVRASLEALASPETLPDLEVSKKLVVDLRGVAGGDTQAAYDVAGLFSTDDLGSLVGRQGALRTFSGEGSVGWEGELVVLVNRGTQGPAEVLTSVLQQSLEATLVGEGTFGHSGRQDLVALSNGGQVQLTSAFYTGPNGELLDDSLEVDLRVRSRVTQAPPVADSDDAVAGPEEESAESVGVSDGAEETDADESVLDPVLERGVEHLLTEEDDEEAEEKLAA